MCTIVIFISNYLEITGSSNEGMILKSESNEVKFFFQLAKMSVKLVNLPRDEMPKDAQKESYPWQLPNYPTIHMHKELNSIVLPLH